MIKPKPVRLQRKRTKGFHLESPNGLPIVYVGRPTIWGNPFRILVMNPDLLDHQQCVRNYRLWLLDEKTGNSLYDGCLRIHTILLKDRRIEMLRRLPELRGKNLSCWCPTLDKDGNPHPCHADVLLELANREPAND